MLWTSDAYDVTLRTIPAAFSVVLAVVVMGVLVGRSNGEVPTRTTFTPVNFDANRAFPMETMGDVGAHADAVVLATVLSEEELGDPEVVERGEGLVGRRITLRLDRTLWQKRNVLSPPKTFDTAGGSWSYNQGIRTPFVWFGDVGQPYVLVLARNSTDVNDNGYEWMHEGALGVPILSGRTPIVINSDKPYFAEIRGKTPDDLERLFATKLGR